MHVQEGVLRPAAAAHGQGDLVQGVLALVATDLKRKKMVIAFDDVQYKRCTHVCCGHFPDCVLLDERLASIWCADVGAAHAGAVEEEAVAAEKADLEGDINWVE